ncbi:MAG: pentapeptide repeat-containing protein, partial [Alcanivoracaceae bacterium]|nr:pentapeptide repeat-containing protein [Alcanivoracaceae bacterium]
MQAVVEFHLAPFDPEQQDRYIRKYAQRIDVDADELRSQVRQLASLAKHTDNPLHLFMMLSVLPRLHQRRVSPETKETDSSEAKLPHRVSGAHLDTHSLLITSSAQHTFATLRLVELYSVFFEDWLDRELKKLRRPNDECAQLRARTVVFCERLAFGMFEAGVTRVDVTPQVPLPDDFADFFRDEKVASPQDNVSAVMQLLQHAQKEDKRQLRISPVLRTEHTYSFLHKSIQEFLCARHISRQLVQLIGRSIELWQTILMKPGTFSKLHLGKTLLTRDYGVLRFMGDLVDSCGLVLCRYHANSHTFARTDPCAHAADMHSGNERKVSHIPSSVASHTAHSVAAVQPLARAFFDVVEASKHVIADAVNVAAANAASVLNASGVPLSGLDWSGVQLGPAVPRTERNTVNGSVHYADLSGAMLHSTCLRRANLSHCRLKGAILDSADLRHTRDDKAEWTSCTKVLSGHTGSVSSVCLSVDGSVLYSGSWDNSVRAWCTRTGSCLQEFHG